MAEEGHFQTFQNLFICANAKGEKQYLMFVKEFPKSTLQSIP